VAAIHLAGVRGEPCGAERLTVNTGTDRQNFKILVLNF